MSLIKTIRQWFGRLTLAIKLTAAIALSTALILVLLVSFTVHRSITMIQDTFSTSNRAVLQMTLNDLDSYYDTLLTYSLSIRNDDNFIQYLTSPSSFGYDEEVYVKSLLRNTFYSRSDIASYTVYMLTVGKSYTITAEYPNVRVLNNPPTTVIPGYDEAVRQAPYLYVSPSKNGGLYTITRIIIDISDGRPLAAVVLEVDQSYIQSLSDQSQLETGQFCLLNSHNRLFYSSNRDVLNSEKLVHISPELARALSGQSPLVEINEVSYLMIADTSKGHGWRLVMLFPKSIIDAQIYKLRNDLIALAIIAALLKLFLIFISARLLTMPLYALSDKVSGKNGKADRMPKVLKRIGGSAEILMLSQQFDELSAKVRYLEGQNKLVLQERDSALLSGLEAQVTPGIIGHTLLAFSNLSARRGHSRLAQLTDNIINLLDYTKNTDDFERVENEVLFTDNYLHLIKTQTFDRFDYRVSCDDQAAELMIPKLCLYSLAENALQRTEKSGDLGDIFISIHVRAQGDIIYIVVSDNAPIPSPAKQEEMNRQIDSPVIGIGTGSGLANLAARLKLMYEDEATITLNVQDDTTITVCIPNK